MQKLQAAKYRVHRKRTFPTGGQRHVVREIIREYGSAELLSEHILSLFLIYFCEWCCKKSFLDGISHGEG